MFFGGKKEKLITRITRGKKITRARGACRAFLQWQWKLCQEDKKESRGGEQRWGGRDSYRVGKYVISSNDKLRPLVNRVQD